MCPATTHVEKVVAEIITTLTQNIVQLGLEQPLVLATNSFTDSTHPGYRKLQRLFTCHRFNSQYTEYAVSHSVQ